MPELPDLVYIIKNLRPVLIGKEVTAVHVKEPVVIRNFLPERFEEALTGIKIEKLVRKGPFIHILMGHLSLIIHPMLAGKLRCVESTRGPGRGFCFSLTIAETEALQYLDDKRMGKVYLINKNETGSVPMFEQQGVDITSPDFTQEKLLELLKGQRKQVRVFLMNQSILSAIGNAYADEILFAAGIHPKTFCNRLSGEEKQRLYQAIKDVIQWGIAEVENAQQPIDVKVRDHVKVRNRKDLPCPQCGTRIRRVGVLGYDSFFCPNCQPASRSSFIEWS
jgi:formamidopyrimidine-DNA glycosylase